MAGVKMVVMYPRPKDIDVFEKLYKDEHIPMALEKLTGKTKLVATRAVALPKALHPFTALRRSTSLPWKRCRRALFLRAERNSGARHLLSLPAGRRWC